MATKVLSFLHVFGTNAARTCTNPNSWAAICMWRLFFRQQEEQEREQIEQIATLFKEATARPIASDKAKDAMMAFKRDTHHHSQRKMSNNIAATTPAVSLSTSTRPNREFSRNNEQILRQPDLSIGNDNNSMYLAQ